MSLSVICPGVSKLPLILGIQPKGNAHLIECNVDPVGMNLNSCDCGAEDRTQPICIEIPPGASKSRRLDQKPLLGDSVGPTTLDRVQHGDGISEPVRIRPVTRASI